MRRLPDGARQDEIRDEVDVQRRAQWEHRGISTGAGRIGRGRRARCGCGNAPRQRRFAVVRVRVGKVELAMTIEKPKIPRPPRSSRRPGMRCANSSSSRNTSTTCQSDLAAALSGLSVGRRHRTSSRAGPGDDVSAGGVPQPGRSADLVVSAAPSEWEWTKWLPHMQHGSRARRLRGAPAVVLLAGSAGELPRRGRGAPAPWSPPSVGRPARRRTPARCCRCGSSSTTTAAPRRTGPG